MTPEEKANLRYNNPVEPYSFETDREEQWYSCGLRDGYIDAVNCTKEDCIKTLCKVYSDLLSAKGYDIGTINSELNRLKESLQDE